MLRHGQWRAALTTDGVSKNSLDYGSLYTIGPCIHSTVSRSSNLSQVTDVCPEAGCHPCCCGDELMRTAKPIFNSDATACESSVIAENHKSS